MTTGEIISYIGLGVVCIEVPLLALRRIKYRTAYALLTLGNTLCGIGSIVNQGPTWVIAFSAAWAAYCAYKWWNDNDDDHPRRRLKRRLKKFQPTRRTAPAAS